MAAICAAGVVLVLVMLAMVGFTLIDARSAVRRQAEQESGNIALTLERDIGRAISLLNLSLQAAARGLRIPGIAEMDPSLRQAVLFDGAMAAEGFGGVFIADETGRVVYDSRFSSVRVGSVADRDFFRQQRDHSGLGLTISVPLRARGGPTIGDWFLAVTRRLDRPDGSFGGTATVALKLSYFQTLFGAIDLGAHGVISLIGSERRLVTRRPYVDADVGRDVTEGAIYDELARSPTGSFETGSTIDGIARLYSYRQVGALPLVVSVGLSTHDIYADWAQKASILGGVMAALVLLGLALVWQMRRELRRRLLAEAAIRQAASLAEQTARELAQAMAPLEAMFRHSPEALLLAGVSPAGGFTYEVVNPAWESMMGIAATAAIGQPPDALLPAALAMTILAGWSDCVRQRRPVRFSFTPPARAADEEWEALAVPILDGNGEVYRLLIVGRDMTEYYRTEARLRQAQKMEVIGRVAAGVSHDFNNILQVITGGVDIVRRNGAIPAAADEFLQMVDDAARRGSDLTHQLLAYARKQTLKPSLLDVGAILADLGRMLTRTAGSRIAVTTRISASLGRVWADRSQLETALMNLALNAVHAMADGGSLQLAALSADAAGFAELQPGRYVVISVSDSGTGMTREVMASMFDPFFSTKGDDGNGLGLGMVQGFAHQSGGDVRASSKLGEGTSFEIWLPEVVDPPAPPEPAALSHGDVQADMHAEIQADVHCGRILLVDDAEDVLITLDAFLRIAGFTVQTAANGREALAEFAAGARFDLLITDFMMPGMSGLELIRHARQRHAGLPALMICGFFDTAALRGDLQDVATLQKPFKRDTLISQVSGLLTQAVAARSAP